MPMSDPIETDSFKTYIECLQAIRRFGHEVSIESGEAWIRDVCFGSPDHPIVRAPLGPDPAALVDRAVNVARTLVEEVHYKIEHAIQVTGQRMEELRRQGEINADDVKPLMARVTALEELRSAFAEQVDRAVPHHPRGLIGCSKLLSSSLTKGEPGIRVRVVTTYVL